MKRRSIRKILLALCASLFMAVGVGGVVNYTYDAHAQEETAVERTGFYVEDGAAVRLKSEYEEFGIRFKAHVGEGVEGATYNILIAPAKLVEIYETATTEKDIITYLTEYATSKGGKLSIAKDCPVNEDGYIYGSLVNILWKNLNLDFVGVAYYEKDGKITVAQYADDGERSVVEISQKALDSGKYTSADDMKALMEKVRYGQMSADGVLESDKESNKTYQYVQFCDKGSTVGVGTTGEETISSQNAQVVDNTLQISATQEMQGYTTINFGELKAGAYRVQIGCELLNESTFSATVSQGTTTLSNVWDMKEVGENLYEFYFTQNAAVAVSFTIASQSTDNGKIAIDKINLSPVALEEFAFSREDYMFGIGGLASNINTSEGSWCDSKVTSEWMAAAVNKLGVESQRVWMSVPHIITRAENSNELSINKDLATQFHNHFYRLKAAGVKRIMVMLSRFVYPYDYKHCSANCAPDPVVEEDYYKEWLEMQYQAFKLIAKEFPEIELWECGNEYDLDTFLYKNGLKDKDSWGLLESARNYTFTNTEKAYITADICYLASKAFKLYNPNVQIIMPGMSKYAASPDEHPYGTGAYYFEELYKHIESEKLPTLETVKVTNPDEYFDIIAYHCYADSVSSFESYNDTLMATAAAHGDEDKRIWITELGFTEAGFGGKGTTEAQEAIAKLAGDLLTNLQNDKYNLIESVFFFRASDTEGLTEENVKESCYGMFYSPNATEKANQAKPLAVTLYNHFNGADATADEIMFWKGAFVENDFEDAAIPNTNIPNLGANVNFYYTSGEIIDYNGDKALKVTSLPNENESGYGYVQFSMGAVEKGRYEFALDAVTEDGYKAIVQFRALSGGVIQEGINNYKTLFDLAKKSGNRYVLSLSISEDYDDYGILLAMSGGSGGQSIILDNVSFTKEETFQTIDFEDGVVQKIAGTGDTTAKIFGGYATTHISTDGNGSINLPNEIVTDENGNKYLTVNYKGWSSWSAFNLGFFKAGNYLVTMDVKLVGGTTNGYFIKRVGNENVALTQNVDYYKIGDTYVFKFTLEQDVANFGIGYQCIAKQNADFIFAYDNITVSNGSWDMAELGTLTAGNYAIAATLGTGTQDGTFVLNIDGTTTKIAPIMQDGNIYLFQTTIANDATVSIGYQYTAADGNAVEIESVAYKALTGDSAVKEITSESFDNISLDNLDDVDLGGVYLANSRLAAELISNANGKALKVTKTGSGWSSIFLSLGRAEKGNYKVTLDISEVDGYEALLQFVTLSKTDGKIDFYTVQPNLLNNANGKYNTLFEAAKNADGTYTLAFALTNDYSSFALALSTSGAAVGSTITIDNVTVEKVSAYSTMNFEDGDWNTRLGESYVGYNKDGIADVSLFVSRTNSPQMPDNFVTENGNTYYKVKYIGYGGYAGFNLGYIEAGTYEVTLDMWLIGDNAMQGGFIYNSGDGAKTAIEPISVNGNTYTFEMTFAADCYDMFIGYKTVSAGLDATPFELGFDNITVLPKRTLSETAELGTLTAGNYAIAATVSFGDGTENGNFVLDVDGVQTAIAPYAKEGDTYLFKTKLAGDATVAIGYQYTVVGVDEYAVEISGAAYKALTGDNTLKTATNAIFDDISFENAENADLGGVYLTNGLSAELVADTNGGKALKLTKNTAGYQVVFLPLGDIEAGNYKLSLDVPETQGFNATLQAFTLTKTDGSIGYTCVQDGLNNYSTIFDVTGKVDNTYTLTFSTNTAYSNFAIGLACSLDTTGGTITIDNMNFERVLLQSIDFEDNKLLDLNDAKLKGDGKTIDVIGFAATTNNLTAGYETADGNTYYQVAFGGGASWTAFNLGYFKAGTYTVTMEVITTSGTMEGNFIYNNGDGGRTAIEASNVDGNTYTFKITLEEDCEDFFIGYASVAGKEAAFTSTFDNIRVTVGTNEDGGASDGYDWIDSIINKNN